MTLTPGSRVGPYEIVAAIGAGGMGEVYRAVDPRLGRTVAIKALHALFAKDPERIARFEREAQLLASLNHPHIAQIYGVEASDAGERYLVLEFVDGRSLADAIRDGAMSVADALPMARQLADALAAAHERGIIHRDLKPGNVMLTADGAVKVLDFGLGKAMDASSGGGRPEDGNSPTMTMAATQAGLILGTAGYMSPEQAKGRIADKRSDVWAFGCVLFEMLAGRRAFEGEDITDTLAAIVRGEPEWAALPASTPAGLRQLIERCLMKNRADRLADMSVVKFILAERLDATWSTATAVGPTTTGAASVSSPAAPPTRATGSGRSMPLIIVLALLSVGLVVSLAALWTRGSATTTSTGGTPIRLSIPLPVGDVLASANMAPVAISPDGTTVVYAANRGGVAQLFARGLSDTAPRPLAGTEGARSPFFSPDGRWIGFMTPRKLKKIALDGAALQVLADIGDGRGAWWAVDDQIYFAPTNITSIWRVPSRGGTAEEVTKVDRGAGEFSHLFPTVTPDGSTLLFTVRTGPGNDERRLVAQDLKTGKRKDLLPGVSMPRFTNNGFLLYSRLDGLFAVPWQNDGLLPGGVPVSLPETPRAENESAADYELSSTGTLVFVPGGPRRRQNRVVWVEPGKAEEDLPLPEREYESVALSPDGQRAVVQVLDGTVGLWMVDLQRHALTPFLVSGESRQSPIWTADGRRIVYRRTLNGFRNLYMKNADGTGDEVRLTNKAAVVHTPLSVSRDGRWLTFGEGGGTTGTTQWMLRIDAGASEEERQPRRFPMEENANDGQVSPDGRWLAYQSEVSGNLEIYVRPFPDGGPRVQVSASGGSEPKWSRDGRTLYYVSLDRKIMAADVVPGSTFAVRAPRSILVPAFKEPSNTNTPFDITPDGRLIGVRQHTDANILNRIDVVLNWFVQLPKR